MPDVSLWKGSAPIIDRQPAGPEPPARTDEPLPDAVGDKVRFWVPGGRSDGLTGTVKAFAAMGMAYVTMDDGSPRRYVPVKYLVRI